ncbi:MAG: hypothetical protein NVSMB42_07470 [Herpetosiphon sp.]
MNRPSYCSFLLRLWCGPAATGAWQGEIEHIQTGTVVNVCSLEEALNVIRREAVKDKDEESVRDRDAHLPGTF